MIKVHKCLYFCKKYYWIMVLINHKPYRILVFKKCCFYFFLLISFKVSFATSALSTNPLPSKSINCLWSKTLFKTFFNLSDKILAITLYTQPTREMGQNLCRCWGLTILGIRVIKESFNSMGNIIVKSCVQHSPPKKN